MLLITLLSLTGCLASSVAVNDDLELVQLQHGGQRTLPDELNGSNMTNISLMNNGTSVPEPKLMRIVFTKSHGADHICLTEIQLLNFKKEPMSARLQEMSSCWGCPVSCEGCTARWGNPNAQFDHIFGSSVNEVGVWSCTQVGSFQNSYGEEYVSFKVDERPLEVFFDKPEVSGEWSPMSWHMQELQPDGTWATVATVKDEPKDTQQNFYVELFGSEEMPFSWPIDYDRCVEQTDPDDPVDVNRLPQIAPLSGLSFESLVNRKLANKGKGRNYYSMAIDGAFGKANLPTGPHVVKQLLMVFPSAFQSVGYPHKAEGDVLMIMQKTGASGVADSSSDLAVVVVTLRLPSEKGETNSTFLPVLGTESFPAVGEPEDIEGNVTLDVLSSQLNGNLRFYSCSETVPWFVVESAGFVSAQVAWGFKQGATMSERLATMPSRAAGVTPPAPMTHPPAQAINSSEPAHNFSSIAGPR